MTETASRADRRPRLRRELGLPFAGRLGLFLAADAVLLGGGLLGGLLEGGAPRLFYALLVLLPQLVLGVPPMAEVVALERRAGSLDLALALPHGWRYFGRRLALLVGLVTAQCWLVVALLWVDAGGGFPLLPALVQPAAVSAFLGAAALFWGARFGAASATWAATLISAAAAWRWTGLNPVPPPDAAPHTLFGAGADLGTAFGGWVVLAAAAAALLLFARRRLVRAEALLPALAAALVLLGTAACRPDPADAPEDRPWPVQAEVVQRATFQPTVLLLGVLRPGRSILVKAPADGIVHYPARFPGRLPAGATVAAGEVLLTLLNPPLDLALAEAQLNLQSAKADLERTQRAFSEGLVPRVDLERAKLQQTFAQTRCAHAELQAAHLQVRAPIAGQLVSDNALPDGSQIGRDAPLAEIVVPGSLQVAVRATPGDLSDLHPGLRGRLRTAAGDDDGTATLTEVPPAADATGSLLLLARVDTVPRRPVAGEGVQLEVALDPHQAVTLPEEALVMTASGPAAFVLSAGALPRHVRLQPVRTAGRAGGRVEIVAGLRPGDRVAVRGTAALTSGAAVIEESPAGAAGEAPGTAAEREP